MRHIEISGKSVDDEGNLYQEIIFRQHFKTKEQQQEEQKALFPAVIASVVEVMAAQK